MFCYKRRTVFIEYYINGIKSRSIGIVKQKLDENSLRLAVEVSGLEDWKHISCKVSAGDAEKQETISELQICNGKGAAVIEIPIKELQLKQYKKIFFHLGNDCYGVADLPEAPENVLSEEKENVTEGYMEAVDEEAQQENEVIADCLEPQPDKWEVIKKKYPILYPFRGQGPYVSIKPVDLQLLNRKYHDLSNNSYLMHAFYRYRHMILGEYTQEKGTFFYVGVPGEFIKKEQSSAAMFGFEGYEHSGDLGYYLYRVEL